MSSCHTPRPESGFIPKPYLPCFRDIRPVLVATILSATAACAEAPAGRANHRQVIIGFSLQTDGQAPATLNAIEKAAGTQLRYVSALSAHSYAYLLACPSDDPACELAIATLRQSTGIEYIQADQTRKLP